MLAEQIAAQLPEARFLCVMRGTKGFLRSRLWSYGRRPPPYPRRAALIARACASNVFHSCYMVSLPGILGRHRVFLTDFETLRSAPGTALAPLLAWAREAVDARLNGLLVNWYDGRLGHYIGRHRDSTARLLLGSPIVTISLGQARVFRMRPWRAKGYRDFHAGDGTVFVMPYATNLAWTHEVTHRAVDTGRRISVTLRAFEGD